MQRLRSAARGGELEYRQTPEYETEVLIMISARFTYDLGEVYSWRRALFSQVLRAEMLSRLSGAARPVRDVRSMAARAAQERRGAAGASSGAAFPARGRTSRGGDGAAAGAARRGRPAGPGGAAVAARAHSAEPRCSRGSAEPAGRGGAARRGRPRGGEMLMAPPEQILSPASLIGLQVRGHGLHSISARFTHDGEHFT